jgi:hypothetical protein
MNKKLTRNASGYVDYTAFHAIRAADREIKKAKQKSNRNKYPRVYICSPYSGDTERNTNNAIRYARFALERERFPIAPHLYLPLFMDDNKPTERELALSFDIRLLGGCREVWVFGDRISEGMKQEIEAAKKQRKPIKYFTDMGGKIQ